MSKPKPLYIFYISENKNNPNTIFLEKESLDPYVKMIISFDKKKEQFCLTDFSGPLPALAFQSECVIVDTNQQWDLSKSPLVELQYTGTCWDTLGAKENFARITLTECNSTLKSQQWTQLSLRKGSRGLVEETT